MAIPFGPFTLEFETDPVKNAEARFQDEQFDRNWDWLEAHASEVFSHRGKVICIAGKELFVGDDVLEVRARAKVAHPEDQGILTQVIPKERGPRIYANQRILATLR